MFSSKARDAAASTVDEVADQADRAMRTTHRAAHDALDSLSQAVNDARNNVSPAIQRLTSQAEALARRSVDAMRDSSLQLRNQADRVSTSTMNFIRDEPGKAILIAAIVGAAVIALASLASRSSDE